VLNKCEWVKSPPLAPGAKVQEGRQEAQALKAAKRVRLLSDVIRGLGVVPLSNRIGHPNGLRQIHALAGPSGLDCNARLGGYAELRPAEHRPARE